jgi:anti-sigma factor RsiW
MNTGEQGSVEHRTNRLSEYLDGDLAEADRREVEAHLAACAECRAVALELRRVRERARGLGDRPPERDLWPGIAAQLGPRADVRPLPRPTARRVTLSVPQLLAAGLLLMALSAGGVWLALVRQGEIRPSMPAPMALTPTESAFVAVARSDSASSYHAAVQDLERVLAERRAVLDTATVRVIEQNLAVIDRAIAEAEAALARDPANGYLNAHLANTMAWKLQLLRRAAAIAVAAS